MIRSFRHKRLKAFFETGAAGKIAASLRARILVRLDALDAASTLAELNQPGFDFHGLKGVPKRYTIHVNGPWCITFGWQDGNAVAVDLEQYH